MTLGIFHVSRARVFSDARDTGETGGQKHVNRLRRSSEGITVISRRLEKRVGFHYNRVQNLTICHLSYQIIAFASVGSSSSVRCDQWWVPFSLSLIPAILYFAALWGALTSYHEIQCELDMYCIEQERIRGMIQEAESQKVQNDVVMSIDIGHVMKPDGFVVLKRLVCIWTVVLMLVGFTVVALCSPRVLLCRR